MTNYSAKLLQIQKEQASIDFKKADRSLDGKLSLSQIIAKQRPLQMFSCMLLLELPASKSARPQLSEKLSMPVTNEMEYSVVIGS